MTDSEKVLKMLEKMIMSNEFRLDTLIRIADSHHFEHIDGRLIDPKTAQHILSVYKDLNKIHQRNFFRMNIDKIIEFSSILSVGVAK